MGSRYRVTVRGASPNCRGSSSCRRLGRGRVHADGPGNLLGTRVRGRRAARSRARATQHPGRKSSTRLRRRRLTRPRRNPHGSGSACGCCCRRVTRFVSAEGRIALNRRTRSRRSRTASRRHPCRGLSGHTRATRLSYVNCRGTGGFNVTQTRLACRPGSAAGNGPTSDLSRTGYRRLRSPQ